MGVKTLVLLKSMLHTQFGCVVLIDAIIIRCWVKRGVGSTNSVVWEKVAIVAGLRQARFLTKPKQWDL